MGYPVSYNVATGKIDFGNNNGRCREQAELDRFLQAYAEEKTKIESRK